MGHFIAGFLIGLVFGFASVAILIEALAEDASKYSNLGQ